MPTKLAVGYLLATLGALYNLYIITPLNLYYNTAGDDTRHQEKANVNTFHYQQAMDGEERARLIWERCKSHHKPAPCPYQLKHPDVRHLPIPQHNMLMCSVGKTGTSNWKTLILLIKGKINEEQANDMVYPHSVRYFNGRTMDNLRYLPQEDYQLYKNMMTKWYKITFVRDPLSRFLSGYRDKFTGVSDRRAFATYQQIRARMMCTILEREFEKDYNPNMNEREIKDYVLDELNTHCRNETNAENKLRVSLGMLIVFLIFTPTNIDKKYSTVLSSQGKVYNIKESRINTHWTNMISLCGHCAEKFRYDFIGTVETMNNDTEFLRQKFGINYQLPKINSTQPGAATSPEVKKMYNELPDILKQYLLKYLQYDAEIFGYTGYNSTVSDEQYPDHRETEDCTILDWK